jgi:hypothetical protein
MVRSWLRVVDGKPLKRFGAVIISCTVEKLGSRRSPLTIEGVGQHLEGGFLEEVGGLAGQQG